MSHRSRINLIIFLLLAFAAILFFYGSSDTPVVTSKTGPGSELVKPHRAQHATAPETEAVPERTSRERLAPAEEKLAPSAGKSDQQASDTDSAHFCLEGCPTGANAHDRRIRHHILELADNPDTKFADWVAYTITSATLGKGCKRTWEADPELSADVQMIPEDYRGIRADLASDRGHQAPLASLCGSAFWQEADYLSNITPQKTDLNEGAWEHLEDGERRLIRDQFAEAVHSITGPLYERAMPALQNAHLSHRVPSGYWKIITIVLNGKMNALAFIMDQETPREADFCSLRVDVKNIESRSSLRFFPEADDAQRAALEASVSADFLHALGC